MLLKKPLLPGFSYGQHTEAAKTLLSVFILIRQQNWLVLSTWYWCAGMRVQGGGDDEVLSHNSRKLPRPGN